MVIPRLRQLVQADFDALNVLIFEKIQNTTQLATDIVNHVIRAGGKQLRPLVVLLSSHACGYKGQNHITLAAMIEFLHTATLLHDDVIDESKMRRGRETANEIWGDKISILVGDYLFTQYMQLMIGFENEAINKLMTDTAFQISFGELTQCANRRQPNISEKQYFDVVRAKTAQLFGASASVTAILSNASPEIQKGMYDYGIHLGNAFQLIDDALDYCGNTAVFGKNIGDDLAFGTPTMPLIYAWRNGSDAQKAKIDQALSKGSLEHLPSILETIAETKALEYTRQLAANEIDRATTALAVLPDSPYKKALVELAQYSILRDR